jgi:hypothetical protein
MVFSISRICGAGATSLLSCLRYPAFDDSQSAAQLNDLRPAVEFSGELHLQLYDSLVQIAQFLVLLQQLTPFRQQRMFHLTLLLPQQFVVLGIDCNGVGTGHQ